LIFGTIFPKHSIEGSDFATNWNDSMWASGGPFIFSEWAKGEFIKLVRNDNYWKTDAETGHQLPYLDSVIWVSPQSVETSTMRRCHVRDS
jgi:peptide/nickel transport system substrate-binding protein